MLTFGQTQHIQVDTRHNWILDNRPNVRLSAALDASLDSRLDIKLNTALNAPLVTQLNSIIGALLDWVLGVLSKAQNRTSGVSWGSTGCSFTAGHALEGKVRAENCNIDSQIVSVGKERAERLSCSRLSHEHPVFELIVLQAMPFV